MMKKRIKRWKKEKGDEWMEHRAETKDQELENGGVKRSKIKKKKIKGMKRTTDLFDDHRNTKGK